MSKKQAPTPISYSTVARKLSLRGLTSYIELTNPQSAGAQECNCSCKNCNCRDSGSTCSTRGSSPESITQYVVNATAAIDINSVHSEDSLYPRDSIHQNGDSLQNRLIIIAPSLEYLSRSPAYRDEQQMRSETIRSFLDDRGDYSSRVQANSVANELHNEMFEFADNMDIDESVQGGCPNSVEMLSEYSAAFTTQSMTQSAILVQVGVGPVINAGNRFLELTERHPPRFRTQRFRSA